MMAAAEPGDSDETWFSLLGPVSDATVDDARLKQLYAYPDSPDRCVVLANFIAVSMEVPP